MGGRVSLLNFVLNSIQIYFFSFYKAPKCVIQVIIRFQCEFLWGDDLEKRKVAWISKWKLCILSKGNVLWSDLLSTKYGDTKSIMLEVGKLLVNKFESLWWKDLKLVGVVEVDDYNWFANNISCKVGNGITIEFYINIWLGSSSLNIKFPLISAIAVSQRFKISNMEDWADNSWILDVMIKEDIPLKAYEEAKLELLLVTLLDIRLCRRVNDSFLWQRYKDGFSVTNSYQVL
ncbi:unnamed protein product [Lathyrus sativus]|nr:unnamed protein product [Lathyrus sativus]